MRTDEEAFKNAMAIAKRMQQAAGTEPMDDLIMALAILVAFALNDLSKTEQEADAELHNSSRRLSRSWQRGEKCRNQMPKAVDERPMNWTRRISPPIPLRGRIE